VQHHVGRATSPPCAGFVVDFMLRHTCGFVDLPACRHRPPISTNRRVSGVLLATGSPGQAVSPIGAAQALCCLALAQSTRSHASKGRHRAYTWATSKGGSPFSCIVVQVLHLTSEVPHSPDLAQAASQPRLGAQSTHHMLHWVAAKSLRCIAATCRPQALYKPTTTC